MNQQNTAKISKGKTLPLVANVIAMIGVGGAMLWLGAETDYKVHALIESILSLVSMFIIGVCLYLRTREADRFFLIVALAFAGIWCLELWRGSDRLDHAGTVLQITWPPA